MYPHKNLCWVCKLGLMDYLPARMLQKALAGARFDGKVPDMLLLLEHPPTYTLGRRAVEDHLLVSREELSRQGVEIHRVDRGGDITFHGPGQLVGYPVIHLANRAGGAGRYLRDLEEVLIRALAPFGVPAGRLPGFTGVWTEGGKIAAIGVKINADRVTEHGFALNLETDLRYFDQIVPCGIRGKAVTSLSRELGVRVSVEEAARTVSAAFGDVFAMSMEEVPPSRLEMFQEEIIERAAS